MDLKICRICCNSQGEFYIFDENNALQICTKIMHCCGKVNISESDGLPSRICRVCENELTVAYQFVLKCEASDSILRSQGTHDRVTTPVSSEHDNHPKVEVKLEEFDHSGHDNHYEEIPNDYTSLDLKQDLEIKPETKLVKRSYKKRKCKVKGGCTCSVCHRSCISRSALAAHMRSHTAETPFQCLCCEKKYRDLGSLKRHIERHHSASKRERNFICENCGKGFYSKNDVKIHIRTHTGETPYVCLQCPMRFTQLSALTRHKKRHAGEKPHTCSTCTKCFCTKEELKLHLKVHTDVKMYKCSICHIPFKYKNNLNKHLLLHTKPNSYVCNYCGRTFNQKGNLKGHIDRQHSDKSGFCSVCTKNVSNIEVHMWRHTGQRPLKCELCSSSFFELKTLARHMNYRHKNPDKYKCTYEGCTMTFPSHPMLLFHTAKLHETGIPFPCDRCSRGFYRKNDLARHKIGTHKERLVV